MKLSEILTEARNGGFISKIAVKDASKVVSNATGELDFSVTIFQRKHFSKNEGEEVVPIFGGAKEINITALENCIKRHANFGMIVRIGTINYQGIIEI